MGKKSKRKEDSGKRHVLPFGFWAQVGAVAMVALSILLVFSWFSAGGRALEVVRDFGIGLIGAAYYLLPILLTYLAVLIFRSTDNRLPTSVWAGSTLVLIWFSGLSGLMNDNGGAVGGFLDGLLLGLMSKGVLAFVLVLFIFITVIFVQGASPKKIIESLFRKFKKQPKTAETETEKDKPKSEKSAFKMNASVALEPAGDKKDKAAPEKQEAKPALMAVSDPNWKMPPIDLLEKKQSPADAGNVQENAEKIRRTLSEFGIDVEMEGANIGPKVTQYTFRPPSGIKMQRITALEDNFRLNLAAKDGLRIEAPIPGRDVVGIEVPNLKYAGVGLRSILESKQWKEADKPLVFAIGKDIAGDAVICDINKAPHLLVAGTTGSGKSVMLNTLITSLLFRNSPSDLRLILIDPKGNELAPYKDIPHLLAPIITTTDKVVSALKWSVNEMERRFQLFANIGAKDIVSYNEKLQSTKQKVSTPDENGVMHEHDDGKMPYIVIVFDEMSDFMMTAKRDIEGLIVRIAQKARAAGIHLVLATQYPKKEVITGLIKGNVPTRISFKVAEQVNSRVILDQVGAEKLLGSGDMLLLSPQVNKLQRIQGAWVSDAEIEAISDFLRMQAPPQYNDDILAQPVQIAGNGGVMAAAGVSNGDDDLMEAARLVVETRKASVSFLQTRLRFGFNKASRIMMELEERGIVSPQDGSRPREVLISSLDELEL
ncbi:MAG: DNA translocase FtsK [Candidatus Nomurabacteria bacterium]|jgi:S-DNA-T family DNA segregation ATPase FtsK/SpoIIIE|nr:DNA translocase FtsK [Candidatus Nomurabacteria bacterium]